MECDTHCTVYAQLNTAISVVVRTDWPLGNHSIEDCVQYQNNDKHCAHRQPENLWCVAAREFVALQHLGLDLWVHG
jgi:hypothetical protein